MNILLLYYNNIMVCHILCPGCSQNLAEVYPFYEKVKQEYCAYLINESKEVIHPDLLEIKSNMIKAFGFILDALELKKICCRQHIISCVDFETAHNT